MNFARVYYPKKGSATQVAAGDLLFSNGRASGTIFRYEGDVRR